MIVDTKDKILDLIKQDQNAKLNPELQQFLTDTPIGQYIKHPLVFQPFISTTIANQQLEQKYNQIRKALDTKNFNQFIFLHERPYRLLAFVDIKRNLNNKNYWKLLSNIWTDTENSYQDLETWRKLFQSKRNHKENLMDEQELETLESLDNELVVYRGCVKNLNENGLSWTLDKNQAKWFANRFEKDGVVLEKQISKKSIVAYFNGRNEEEVIVT
jgi:hypothetical protein